MRFQRPSTERSAAFRSSALSLAKSCSIGLKSGEWRHCKPSSGCQSSIAAASVPHSSGASPRGEWRKTTCGSTKRCPTSETGVRQRAARNAPEATGSARAMATEHFRQGQNSEIAASLRNAPTRRLKWPLPEPSSIRPAIRPRPAIAERSHGQGGSCHLLLAPGRAAERPSVRKDTLRKAPWVIATLISPGRGGPAQDSP
jgi:hypothetical protein